MFRHSMLLLVVLLGTQAGCRGDEEASPDASCQDVLEHVLDLQLPPPTGERASAERLERTGAHRDALRRATGERILADCATREPAFIECVLAARTTAAVEACVTGA